MNYKVQPTGQIIDLGQGYGIAGADVIETKTNQTIVNDVSMPNAKLIARHLNFGGGFDGFTPSFFNEKLKTN
jgi:16S rRNA G1207 methylase RsmC